MNDLIFNLRIWNIHFQIKRQWGVKFFFAWYDMWIGLYVDKKNEIYYLMPIPTVGIKTTGLWISWNNHYSFKKDPFIWLFDFRGKYYPMRDYHNLNQK